MGAYGRHWYGLGGNVSLFLSRLLLRVCGSELLYPGSGSAFRYRWNHLLRTLLVPSAASLTRGCLRAGGTVELYRQGMQIMDILWSLRLKNLETLQHYLQEISTQVTMIDLPLGIQKQDLEFGETLPTLHLHGPLVKRVKCTSAQLNRCRP